MLNIPLPKLEYRLWFEHEFGYPLEEYWNEKGLDLDKFKYEILQVDVSDELLLSAIAEKFGSNAAQCVKSLEEYLLFQYQYKLAHRFN